MKIYIAGHNQEEARKIAEMLKEAGHTITSTWINADFEAEASLNDSGKQFIANKDIGEILSSDTLMIFSSPRRVPGGKFVECGVAIGSGKQVYLIGHRENFLMYSSSVKQFSSVEDFIAWA